MLSGAEAESRAKALLRSMGAMTDAQIKRVARRCFWLAAVFDDFRDALSQAIEDEQAAIEMNERPMIEAKFHNGGTHDDRTQNV